MPADDDFRTVTPQAVAEACRALGRETGPEQAEGLATYLDALMRWNRRVNLVGRKDWHSALADLVADSWHVADALRGAGLPEAPRCLDLGAGAGLPGVPLRLFWPKGDYWLVEVRAKRLAFLRYVLGSLGPPNTHVWEGRAEQALERLGPADLVLSRAFMPWPGFLALVRDHLAPRGVALVMASEPFAGEAPAGWSLAGEHAYAAGVRGEETRYSWLFTPARDSR
jgi:16S rRNA (guanine527-N7)-methyltransferase